jgi:hypothetical protein
VGKDVNFVDLTRSSGVGFIGDAWRLIEALSRAKYLELVYGNLSMLDRIEHVSQETIWITSFLRDCQRRNYVVHRTSPEERKVAVVCFNCC